MKLSYSEKAIQLLDRCLEFIDEDSSNHRELILIGAAIAYAILEVSRAIWQDPRHA